MSGLLFGAVLAVYVVSNRAHSCNQTAFAECQDLAMEPNGAVMQNLPMVLQVAGASGVPSAGFTEEELNAICKQVGSIVQGAEHGMVPCFSSFKKVLIQGLLKFAHVCKLPTAFGEYSVYRQCIVDAAGSELTSCSDMAAQIYQHMPVESVANEITMQTFCCRITLDCSRTEIGDKCTGEAIAQNEKMQHAIFDAMNCTNSQLIACSPDVEKATQEDEDKIEEAYYRSNSEL
ncbi:hypothetical protein BV898_00786 [Hypsibius exemplaris]|uniref:DUF19 domain-containing protein n=1 Tax=Hypsibius exemplaris TaxID=2072580 RepID=A0A1W0XCA5_HYPEX|nr:hypothetical protein BV898_00786 [Hypsibius exemplaris]